MEQLFVKAKHKAADQKPTRIKNAAGPIGRQHLLLNCSKTKLRNFRFWRRKIFRNFWYECVGGQFRVPLELLSLELLHKLLL